MLSYILEEIFVSDINNPELSLNGLQVRYDVLQTNFSYNPVISFVISFWMLSLK